MTDAARYVKIVEWSDADGAFVGQCPGVIGPCCHGSDEAEVYRVLRPGGRLVVTYLPNWLSVGELRLRRENVWGRFHRRLYGREETATMLKHTGFYPVTPVLYQSFTWEGVLRRMIRSAGLARGLARVARVLFPAQVFAASTLCCVAEKLEAM